MQGKNKIKSRSIVSSYSQIVKKRSNTQRIIYLQSYLRVRPLNFIQMHTARQLSDRTLGYFTKIIGLVYARNNYETKLLVKEGHDVKVMTNSGL